jgi:hypothetical protein
MLTSIDFEHQLRAPQPIEHGAHWSDLLRQDQQLRALDAAALLAGEQGQPIAAACWSLPLVVGPRAIPWQSASLRTVDAYAVAVRRLAASYAWGQHRRRAGRAA